LYGTKNTTLKKIYNNTRRRSGRQAGRRMEDKNVHRDD
jgi:hypothetical protein